jgi:hypothetical protein
MAISLWGTLISRRWQVSTRTIALCLIASAICIVAYIGLYRSSGYAMLIVWAHLAVNLALWTHIRLRDISRF